MKWIGQWKNQYGSILEITAVNNNIVTGVFRTALEDSGFYGQEIPVSGYCQGDCIGISGGGVTNAGDMLVTYTGLLRGDTLETMWLVVNDSQNWWKALLINADKFERVHT